MRIVRMMVASFAAAWTVGVAAPPAGAMSPAVPCQHDADCDDGVFCNGFERCKAGGKGGARTCVLVGSPCAAGQQCEEALARCVTPGACTQSPDADNDGRRFDACSEGLDCDDADPARQPGRLEVCDAAGHDEDCNPRTTGASDFDGDGFLDATCNNTVKVSLAKAGPILLPASTPGLSLVYYGGNDCDDHDPRVGPYTQVCDGAGVRVCMPVVLIDNPRVPSAARVHFEWQRLPCGAGQVCVPQPNGAGVCMGPPVPPVPPKKDALP